ncbi:MAG: hypothetical protein HKO56_00625 [Bacteroidia bacterium]|nr:hypothetical protein [Bacteroidia bacterium]NNM15129.1 hypothetical protein [Bacteroidia bacterium]
MENKTNIIIAGVNKAGTTSLFTYLGEHPEICPSSIKETCYFLPLRYGNAIEPISTYNKYFKNCSDKKFLLESTPGYFYGGTNLSQKIKETLPNTKLIFSLRNPVERLISFYRFKKNHLELPAEMTFSEYINKCKSYSKEDFKDQTLNPYFGLEGGKYVDYIKDWESFNPDDILFIDFGGITSDPSLGLIDICNWLKLDSNFYSTYEYDTHNKSVAVKNRSLQKVALSANKKLEKIFRENKKLKQKLKTIYYKMNGKKMQEQIDENLIKELDKFYEPYSVELLKYFNDKKRTDAPKWVLGSPSVPIS